MSRIIECKMPIRKLQFARLTLTSRLAFRWDAQDSLMVSRQTGANLTYSPVISTSPGIEISRAHTSFSTAIFGALSPHISGGA
jgi:hypothetical protein